jgi:hypothetical protein
MKDFPSDGAHSRLRRQVAGLSSVRGLYEQSWGATVEGISEGLVVGLGLGVHRQRRTWTAIDRYAYVWLSSGR